MVNEVSGEFLGCSLTVPQRLAIRTSLSKLRISENNANINFWGKISGTTRDYFIAQGATCTDCIKKSYFVSSDEGVNFSKLPEVDEFIQNKVATVRGLFTGNPANIYKDPNAPAEEEEEEPEEDEGDEPKADDPSKRKLTELERLSHTVQSIDNDTCVQPRGAYLLTPTGLIQENKAFSGFNSTQCTSLDNYLLFRDPQCGSTLSKMRTLGVTNKLDFLDPVCEDQPKGVWVAQVDAACTEARLRSLVWPGYEFKMQVSSNVSSGAYFGNGMKNDDVMFML
jgi:radial spoke head protein 9